MSELSDTLLQVRTGKIKPLHNTYMKSAIYKSPHEDRVYVTKTGLRGDEQEYEHHGGTDKALHHYCASHYTQWKKDCPQSAHRFALGGFGENFVSHNLNEGNLCIGDVFSVGCNGVRIIVGEPRQPCYKLNHRFKVRNMSKRAQDTGRTGWYYRVLQEGWIKAGDKMTLIERKHPKWTLANVQHYLHHDKQNTEAMKELSQLPELGSEIKQIFQTRLERQNQEDESGRLLGGAADLFTNWTEYRVLSKTLQAPDIYSFILQPVDPLPSTESIPPGSHIRLKLGPTGKLVRAYSIINTDPLRMEIGVQLSPTSRGGSRYIHQQLQPQTTVLVSPIATSFPLYTPPPDTKLPTHHIFIAGGIGLTALLPMALHLHHLQQQQQQQQHPDSPPPQTFEFHLSLHNPVHPLPFHDHHLTHLPPSTLHLHITALGTRLSLATLLSTLPPSTTHSTHIYACGPPTLLQALQTHLPIPLHRNLHIETFLPPPATTNTAFTAHLPSQNLTRQIPATKSLLEVLRDLGMEDSGLVSSGCEVGACGNCWVGVKSVDGRVERRGIIGDLGAGQGVGMLSCVDRVRREVGEDGVEEMGMGSVVLDF